MRQQRLPDVAHGQPLSILIVCDNASAVFGGEALLPLHYFRTLRNRGHKVWLVTHARTRSELTELFPDEQRIYYVEDSWLHRLMWRVGRRLSPQLASITTGFVSRLAVQMAQRTIVRSIVATEGIDIVHQPTPVSPREPSLMYGLGAPVIVGPMNGGMDYPAAFQRERGWLETALRRFGQTNASLLNALMPGKRQAALLLVANARSRAALPDGLCKHVVEVVENGVDLDLWTPRANQGPSDSWHVCTFAFMGRLVRLKAVDLLLEAFSAACAQAPMRLVIMGDGEEREELQRLANTLLPNCTLDRLEANVRFTGWLSQTACARELEQVDCLVMPSLRDCGGSVVLEAMSMSKPVIATAWGGPLDYLDASCGILIEPRDRQSLGDGMARAMVRLAKSPLERAAMGCAARAKIESKYDWELKTGHMLSLYRRTLTMPTPGAPAVGT